VLVAKAGFTRQARTKAEALNVDVLTLAEAKVVDWTTIAGKQPHLSVATVTTIIVAASGVFAWDGPSGPLPGLVSWLSWSSARSDAVLTDPVCSRKE